MELQKGYEVIRFIDQGNLTRITMDYRKGVLLLNWLKENRMIEKEVLYQWIAMLVKQICLYHRCQKNQCYRYLSPESVLVSPDGQLYLLDLEAESNAFVMRDMQRREMRQHFMKKEMCLQYNMRLETDFYSLGKTIQFLLAHVTIDPKLSQREENQIYHFVQKCLGNHPRKSYHDLDKIQKEIPHYKKEKKHKKIWVVPGILFVTALAMFFVFQYQNSMKNVDENVKKVTANTNAEGKESEEENGLAELELGGLQEKLMQQYELILQNNTTEDNQKIITTGEEMELELISYLATAYDREEEYEKAVFYYGIQTRLEVNQAQLERIYQRKATIEEQLEQYEEARATYKAAMQACEKSEAIALRYLTFICKHDSANIELQNEGLQAVISALPELKETEAFKKLQQEYGIQMEEEKIWIKKENG